MFSYGINFIMLIGQIVTCEKSVSRLPNKTIVIIDFQLVTWYSYRESLTLLTEISNLLMIVNNSMTLSTFYMKMGYLLFLWCNNLCQTARQIARFFFISWHWCFILQFSLLISISAKRPMKSCHIQFPYRIF